MSETDTSTAAANPSHLLPGAHDLDSDGEVYDPEIDETIPPFRPVAGTLTPRASCTPRAARLKSTPSSLTYVWHPTLSPPTTCRRARSASSPCAPVLVHASVRRMPASRN